MIIQVSPQNIVRCKARIALPLSAATTWGQLRDFHRFASQDYFHAKIVIDGAMPRCGTSLRMLHQFAGIRTLRRGRILRWRENDGFAFSDVSLRGNRVGFPHVLSFRLEPTSPSTCLLHITVMGRWTAPVWRWTARLWLRWVFAHIVHSTENQLLLFALFRRRHVSVIPG